MTPLRGNLSFCSGMRSIEVKGEGLKQLLLVSIIKNKHNPKVDVIFIQAGAANIAI